MKKIILLRVFVSNLAYSRSIVVFVANGL